MRKILVVAALLFAGGCASRWPVVRAKLDPLRGKTVAEVSAALCDECKLSRNGRQAVCKVYMSDGCDGGRHNRVKLFFDAEGRLEAFSNAR